MELTAASRTKGAQRKSHKTGTKSIMARQDLSRSGSLHGPSAGFTEQQQDTKRDVRIIWGFAYLACITMYWRVLG